MNAKFMVQTLIWYIIHVYYIERKIISRKLYKRLENLFTHIKKLDMEEGQSAQTGNKKT